MISMQENMSARTLALSSSAQRTFVRFIKLPLVDKIPPHTAHHLDLLGKVWLSCLNPSSFDYIHWITDNACG
jgi:hypothetical protein